MGVRAAEATAVDVAVVYADNSGDEARMLSL